MTKRRTSMRLLIVLSLLLSACDAAPPDETETMRLRVMTFNIEWGGKNVSFPNVVEAIRISGADIVGVQEAEGNLEELASELGWYFDERNYVISRFPVLDPPEADGRYAYVEVRPGLVVAIGNLHLPDAPYGPDLVKEGRPTSEIMENEHLVRVSWLSAWLEKLDTPMSKGVPTFVTGDFNAPSHNDYADIEWPTSVAMEGAGFVDVWRAVHPEVASKPGLTWWAARPELEQYAPGEGDPEDRIDFIWSSAGTRILSADLVGEEGYPGVTYSVKPWPSDHRAVVSEFEVEPAPMPELLTTGRRVYELNDVATLRFNFVEPVPSELVVQDLGRQSVERYSVDDPSGEIEFPAPQSGAYVAKVTDRKHSRRFWVLEKDAEPVIEVTQDVQVRWRNGPGFRNDYVAVYASDAVDDNQSMLHYIYVDSLPHGELDLRATLAKGGEVLLPGRYVVKLMKDDGYTSLAQSAEFVVE